ncbi:dTDP-4-dehydrorhamnose 3,5-epimerase [Niallia circulans]|uniref:dTDP-4-dehydrorhamnose reductase n=1 Tax=Niallia circulans TaxID=1397 RepID=UPI00077CCC4F|nr:dTDP-4-dehydrorhamnose reductase [Niallia circulans]MDR4316504.1 dTDP-4-dehydrorhamnose reductase [Niallia circulans]MED3838323.1 dTDP-4-dehydrorhamnose reductase [Niallia circulans]MED4243798.1 dTDP-4-dehydrorhamnose reductase [Niallia circulans]MED4246190.1 dTDP-4-dehydrorhamnose reductase [Niallia circulans]NRG33722.1 dTDP-4-dehydrorhamnose reductase [Niallia circulans]
MKILVTGYSGQLGYDVVLEGKKRGFDMIGVGHKELDITQEEQVRNYIHTVKPDVVIHCAAYTAVDNAEDNKDVCFDVNVNGTKYLAASAKSVDAKFIYISTDYVFEGTGTEPFTEEDAANPVGYYGITKYEGEKAVQSLLDKYFIIRISWVFGINGNNFIKTMLRLAETRKELNVVGDQYGSPTYTFDLAKLLLDMAETEKYGVYHASNEGFTTWADFAKEIFQVAGKAVKVNSITTEEYPTKAVRPKNSRMSKDKLEKNGFTRLPAWQDALTRYIAELQEEVN